MSEARLDITGDGSKAQAALDKTTRENARLREDIRKLNEQAKKGFKESSDAVNDFGGKLSTASAKTNAWADGMRKLREQANLGKADFSVLLSAMQKTAMVKEPFAGWTSGLEKLRQQNDKWAAGMKRMEEQNRSVFSSFKGGFITADQEQSLERMLLKYASISAATAGIIKLYSSWREHTDGLVDAHRRMAVDVTKTLAEAGKLQLHPQVDAAIKTLAEQGITPQQSQAALAGVMTSGTELSSDRQLAVFKEVAKLGPTQIDLSKFGEGAANVAEALGDKATPERIVDFTAAMKRELGAKFGQFTGQPTQKAIEAMKASGMTGEDALANIVVGLQAEQSPRTIAELFGPGRLSREQRMQRSQTFGTGAAGQIRGRLEQADLQNLAAQQISAVPTEVKVAQRVDSSSGLNALEFGGQAWAISMARKEIAERAYARGGGYGKNWAGAMFYNALSFANEFSGRDREFQESLRKASPEQREAMIARERSLYGSEIPAVREILNAQEKGIIGPDDGKEIIRLLREQNAQMKAEASRPRPINVDAHNE